MHIDHDQKIENLHLEQLSWMFFSTVRKISRNLDLHSRDLEKEFGLTVPQLNVLASVGAAGRVPIGRIAVRNNLSSATVTTIVDRLEDHGLVVRERSADDKRQVFIVPTERGREILLRGPQPFHDCFVRRLGEMEPWQRTELLSALQYLAALMDPEEPVAERQKPLEARPSHTSQME
ncbi:MAG: MarR family winged helix-turn-helix transcriptional regulator [Spirochaetota bacterium]